MFKKKWFRVLALSVATVVVLITLFVVAFIVNPFEGSLPDMRGVVPRDVDFFVRKRDLGEDFPAGKFPEPHFWAELTASEPWRQMQGGPLLADLRKKGIETSLAQLRDALRQVHEQSGGMLDVVRDVIGTELELAGKFRGARPEDTEWCAYLRVSWRAIAACNLAGFSFVQERAKTQGSPLRSDGELLAYEPAGQKPIWLARYLDCVIAGNSKELVTRSLGLATRPDGESLGRSAEYMDGVESVLREWEKRAKVERANALEVYLRPDVADQVFKFAERWPNPNAPDDMNERVLASFINMKGWRFLAGALVFEPGSLSVLAKVDLNRNLHTPFQSHFFQTEAQERGQWLDPFLTMVPIDACACAAMRMPAGEFLREMFRALEQPQRDLLNDCARKVGYSGVTDLIEKLEGSFLPRTGFVFRKNVRDKDFAVAEPTPVPQIAWVFWTREGAKKPLKDLIDTLYRYVDTFNLKPYKLNMTADREGDSACEFANPQIPGTGQFALMVFDRFFILSNSGPLIRDMFQARFEPRYSVMSSPNLTKLNAEGEIPNSVNGFVYIQGRQLQTVLEDYQLAFDARQAEPDAEWMYQNRGHFEQKVFQERYSRFASKDALDEATKAQFRKDVDAYMDEQWRKGGKAIGEPTRAAMRQAIALARMFSAACFTVNLDSQWLKLAGRALVEYR